MLKLGSGEGRAKPEICRFADGSWGRVSNRVAVTDIPSIATEARAFAIVSCRIGPVSPPPSFVLFRWLLPDISMPSELLRVVLIWMLPAAWVAAGESVRFNRDVRPILSENCFHCHGPDDDDRHAGLRLDLAAAATEWAIKPGDAEQSELILRITTEDPDLRMPPPDSERSLTAEQIETLRRWIDQGAEYEGHWAFIPPRRPSIPDLPGASAHPIDRFILSQLHDQGWQLAPPADRETLLRRVTFDLTGLPPTLAEIEGFLTDDSSGAYERVLDRLLARQSYGERMASDWLDAARYSDTYGYQVDRDRFVWPWRDWVVDAFNANLPYDQFITWQIAGDLLPAASREQILATTFNRLHPQKVEGGSVPEEFRMEYVADRTQTFAMALLGLTFECCRCHNHKYDPISQREYYQLSAYFDNISEAGLYSYFTEAVPTPTLTLPTDAQSEQLQRLTAEVAERSDALDRVAAERLAQTLAQASDHDLRAAAELRVQPIKTVEFDSDPPGENRLVDGVFDNAFELTGDDPVDTDVGNFHRWQPFSIALWIHTPDVKDRAVVLHRSKAWTDAGSRGYQLLIENGRLSWSLIHFLPGNAISIQTQEPIPVGEWLHVAVTNDGSSRAAGLEIFVNGQRASTEIVRDSLTKNMTGGGGDHIRIGERMRDKGFKRGRVDRLQIFDCQLTELEVRQLAQRDGTLHWTSHEAFDPDQRRMLAEHDLVRGDETIQQLGEQLTAARSELCQVQDAVQEIMVMREEPQRRDSYLLIRGAYDNRGERVEPGTPAVLPPVPADAPPNRLGLAQWLCDPDHPLTARVAVNRMWQLCFGRGLVRTPEDFGSQGAPPTHPELLDFLAVEFVASGWDTKAMLKRIMMSQTYQQSNRNPAAELAQRDPENRLWGRFPAYRLPAEMLRDSALAVSGRLLEQLGGPPVKPYELAASFKPSEPDTGAGLYRRSLYTYWKRTAPAPAMMTLDAAKRDVCRVERERTSSPLQAFVLMNGPQFVEAARGLAERTMARHADHTAAMAELFLVLTSRRATTDELQVLNDLLASQQAYFRQHPDRAKAYLQIGQAEPARDFDDGELAAMTVVASTVMNFDDSVMKR